MANYDEELMALEQSVGLSAPHTIARRDDDAYFTIDPVTRLIKGPEKKLMQGDHNSEVFTFSLPRYIEGHDMLNCSSIRINYLITPSNVDGMYEVEDAHVDPDNEDNVLLSWGITGNATCEAGLLTFWIEFLCYDGEILLYSWHTDKHSGVTIGETHTCAAELAIQYADIIAQWEQRLFSLNAEGVDNIVKARESALANISTVENKAVANVNATKEDAKSEINSAKNSSIDAIEAKGKETLDTIPVDYIKLNNTIAANKAECDKLRIINSVSGSMIAASDSAELPIPGMRIFGKTKQATTTGKNKLPYMGYRSKNNNPNGLTYTENEDESITISGTTTGYSMYYLCETNIFENGKQYAIPKFGDGNIILYVNYLDAEGKNCYEYHFKSFVWSSEYTFKAIYLQVNNKTVNETIYPIIVEGSTYDGNWEPYTGGMPSPNPSYPQVLERVGDDGSVEQYVKGKNLLNNDVSAAKRVTVKKSNNQVITRSGYELHLPVGTYTATLTDLDATVVKYWYGEINDANGNYVKDCMLLQSSRNMTPLTFTINEGDVLFMYDGQDKSLTGSYDACLGLCQVQIEAGTVATPYEPYKSQSLTIPTPNGLPGVPVSSGGNYTDENGQQYVSDYKDYERMVYVQRVGEGTIKITRTGTSSNGAVYGGWNSPSDKIYAYDKGLLCERAIFRKAIVGTQTGCIYENADNFIVVGTDEDTLETLKAKYDGSKYYYVLKEPIETPLSEEEIAAYKTLHTNYPNTTIYNDDGAYTEVKYVADTKNYVDNKIAAEIAKIAAAGI